MLPKYMMMIVMMFKLFVYEEMYVCLLIHKLIVYDPKLVLCVHVHYV